MVFFSSRLKDDKYCAKPIFDILSQKGVEYSFINNDRDIWVRDFMPVKTKGGRFVSFRYSPSYLNGYDDLRTDYKKDVSSQFNIPIIYSDINLDGGNIVFSPSKGKAVISDRVFFENPQYSKKTIVDKLEKLLEANVIIIPSLKSDMTGHADGMVRFVDEHTVVGNKTDTKNGLEQRIERVLKENGIETIPFVFEFFPKDSAVGCYLNFLETEESIFFPAFGINEDESAIKNAEKIFKKEIVPVRIEKIAQDGGGLNCISWEL